MANVTVTNETHDEPAFYGHEIGTSIAGIGMFGLSDHGKGVVGDGRVGVSGSTNTDERDAAGVMGYSHRKAPGVKGHSEEGFGGHFKSGRHGQLYLESREVDTGADGNPKLPANGSPGELLAVGGPTACTLWLCVAPRLPLGGSHRPAQWAQVQLGDSVNGTA